MTGRASVRRVLPAAWGAALAAAMAAVLAASATGMARSGGPVADPPWQPSAPTTLRDFFGPGTQPGELIEPLHEAGECSICHGFFDEQMAPYTRWAASMMGQGARDPIFWAALAIAEQAAPHVADFCIRCHAPRGWTDAPGGGRPGGDGGGGVVDAMYEGISCSVCHRMVDPVYVEGSSPAADKGVLEDLKHPPRHSHSSHYVLDPLDRRRGPFDLGKNFLLHKWVQSPFHREARMCATCHDVTNPVFTMRPDGTYALNALDEPHPTHDPYDGFPLERTYSEWSMSEFARRPVDLGGRFGGNRGPMVSTCQDCHMPTVKGTACQPFLGGEYREDLPQHDFRGATTWMLRAVRNLYPDWETGLSGESVTDAIARNTQMLRDASDMYLAARGDGTLLVRVINQTGHKLPTGHLEGRRMWVNVRFFDAAGTLVAEHGGYDWEEARLDHHGTKVYEAVVGLDEEMARTLGVEAGPSHLFPLNNMFYLDNRIPPRGFTNEGFAAVQSAPVGYTYRDGQYWDDSVFAVPAGAARAEARLYYQTITREAVEALRDFNTTNDAGEVLYEQWLATGKSAPVEMDNEGIGLRGFCRADLDGDGACTIGDLRLLLDLRRRSDPRADFNDDGVIDGRDVAAFARAYAACRRG